MALMSEAGSCVGAAPGPLAGQSCDRMAAPTLMLGPGPGWPQSSGRCLRASVSEREKEVPHLALASPPPLVGGKAEQHWSPAAGVGPSSVFATDRAFLGKLPQSPLHKGVTAPGW